MKDFTAKRITYEVLKDIYLNGAYSSIELDKLIESSPVNYRGYITAIVYSTLELDIKVSYIIKSIAPKKIKPSLFILLKMGATEILTSKRSEALIVNEYVAFAKDRFRGMEGFVNAVLRKISLVSIPLTDKIEDLSNYYSVPVWLIDALINDYGLVTTKSLLSLEIIKKTHIRANTRKITNEMLESKLKELRCEYLASGEGYFVDRSALTKLNESDYTSQSVSSILASKIYVKDIADGINVLDVCAAPGGKSILVSELLPNSSVLSLDVHEHRVNLIKSYAKRMGANIKVKVNDGTKLNEEYVNNFDLVITDVPCSGSGLFKSSIDILLFKSEKDVDSLNALQLSILATSSKYVKVGGVLCYSTCSILKRENENIVSKFLKDNPCFSPLKENNELKIMPEKDRDGFYIYRMERVR